jgi:hypothetical protein
MDQALIAPDSALMAIMVRDSTAMAVTAPSDYNRPQFFTSPITRKPLNLSGFSAFQQIAKSSILL